MGALNFLAIDDLAARRAATTLASECIVSVPFEGELPIFPAYARSADDPFLRRLNASGRHWVVLVDPGGEPRLMLDADGFLREAIFGSEEVDLPAFLYQPAVIKDGRTLLGVAIQQLEARALRPSAHPADVVLLWGAEPSLITGDDILRCLLSGTPGSSDAVPS